MDLTEKRRAIRRLLNETNPADAAAVYYVFHHRAEKIQITTYPPDSQRSLGYVCSAMTGIDLFRPLVTMRLPLDRTGQELDYSKSLDLIYGAFPNGGSLIISTYPSYYPLLSAILDIQREDKLRLLILDRTSFSPIINVLVTETPSHNDLPRYVIRKRDSNSESSSSDVIASAGINWWSASFAEIYVHTSNNFRRRGMGRSVVAYIVQSILDSGRTPLYVVSAGNDPSYQLARSVGFIDTGEEEILVEGTLKPRPVSHE
jgi:hypothetical protein